MVSEVIKVSGQDVTLSSPHDGLIYVSASISLLPILHSAAIETFGQAHCGDSYGHRKQRMGTFNIHAEANTQKKWEMAKKSDGSPEDIVISFNDVKAMCEKVNQQFPTPEALSAKLLAIGQEELNHRGSPSTSSPARG